MSALWVYVLLVRLHQVLFWCLLAFGAVRHAPTFWHWLRHGFYCDCEAAP